MVREVATALGFLTRFPTFSQERVDLLAASVLWFPLIGGILGIIAGIGYGIGVWVGIGSDLCGLMAVGLLILMSGGLHEDGLADSADGIGGEGREERYRLMKDSRLGVFGVLALIFSVGLRSLALGSIGEWQRVLGGLVSNCMLSRWWMVWVMFRSQAAQPVGLSRGFGRPSHGRLIGGGGLTVLVCFWMGGAMVGGMVIGLTFLSVTLLKRLSERFLGGYTGDTLGAIQQVSEILGLVIWAASVGS